MILYINTPRGFRFDAVVHSHGWSQLPPFSLHQEPIELERIHKLNSGELVRLLFRAEGSGIEIKVQDLAVSESDQYVDELRKTTRAIFQLDLNLRPFYDLLKGRKRYSWVARMGAGRLLRSPTVWEDLVKTLMTTNTAWAATSKMVERVVGLGDEYRPGQSAFPSPRRIASLDVEALAESVRAGYRTQYLHELAGRIAAGKLDVESWADSSISSDELYEQLRSLKGYGPYAAGVVMKLLGRHDRLSLDTSARAMFKREFSPKGSFTDSDIEAHYEEFGSWRGLVLWMDLLRPYMGEGA